MRISVPKTFRMKIEPGARLKATTAEDVDEMNFKFSCAVCGRKFPYANSLPKHKRYCDGADQPHRPYRNQKANKLVADKKRAAIIATRPNVVLNDQKIGNVAEFQYLGALVTGYGNDADWQKK